MKTIAVAAIALPMAATGAHAIQETLTSAGPLNCTAVSECVQNTADNLFMSSPLVRGVRAIRLTGINGATAFRIGMLNLTAR